MWHLIHVLNVAFLPPLLSWHRSRFNCRFEIRSSPPMLCTAFPICSSAYDCASPSSSALPYCQSSSDRGGGAMWRGRSKLAARRRRRACVQCKSTFGPLPIGAHRSFNESRPRRVRLMELAPPSAVRACSRFDRALQQPDCGRARTRCLAPIASPSRRREQKLERGMCTHWRREWRLSRRPARDGYR